METKETGYLQQQFGIQTKRYCQMLDLENDPELLAEYVANHAPENSWPEISEGIRACGVLEMEIYILENHLFMIVDTAPDFEWESAFKYMMTLDRQLEWEEKMLKFMVSKMQSVEAKKWVLMDRIFKVLPKK